MILFDRRRRIARAHKLTPSIFTILLSLALATGATTALSGTAAAQNATTTVKASPPATQPGQTTTSNNAPGTKVNAPIVSQPPSTSPASPSAPLATPTPQSEPPIPIPAPPTVNDPMLAPVPPAPKVVTTWEETLQLIRSQSTDLRIAMDAVVHSEALRREALAAVLPQLNGSIQYQRNLFSKNVATFIGGSSNSITSPSATTSYGATLSWPVGSVANWQAVGTADVQIDISKLSLEDEKRILITNAAQNLVSVVTAERVAELNRVSFRNALERLDLAQRKTNLGAGTGLDVVRAQQDVETARATLVTGDESLLEAREALGLALGIPGQIGVAPSLDMNGLEESAQRVCNPGHSVEDRADVASQRQQVHAAKRQVDNVWTQFLPSASLQSNIGATLNNTGINAPAQWTIGALISIPIWDGGRRYGLLRDARQNVDVEEQQLEALRRNATVQVIQAARNVGVAEQSRVVAANARQLAAENDRLTRVGYVEGKYTSNDLILSAVSLRDTEIQLALQEFKVVQAKITEILAEATCPVL